MEINSFCKAIIQGDIETVKSLIALGEDVNRKSLGKTPAIFAARYNQAEILKVLIEKGADLTIRCDHGFTIKKYAELSNAKEVLAVLETVM
jgi:ankyrin repeat protein